MSDKSCATCDIFGKCIKTDFKEFEMNHLKTLGNECKNWQPDPLTVLEQWINEQSRYFGDINEIITQLQAGVPVSSWVNSQKLKKQIKALRGGRT